MIEDAVFEVLSTTSGVTAIVGAGSNARIYPILAPEAPQYPLLVFLVVTEQVENAMGKSTDLVQRRLQIDCWGATATAAQTLGDAVVAALDRYSGEVVTTAGNTGIQDFERVGVQDIFDAEARRFKRVLDFIVSYIEG